MDYGARVSGGGDGQADLPNAPKISGSPDIISNNTVSAQRAKLTKQADNQAVWQAAGQGKSALPTAFGQTATISPNGEDINQYNQKNQARQTSIALLTELNAGYNANVSDNGLG